MKTKLLLTLTVIFFLPALGLSQQVVDFETLIVGSQFGPPTYNPGDIIFTQDNISVSVHDFHFDASNKHFGSCEVVNALPDFGDGKIMSVNNINLLFDFTNLGGKSFCRFEYADFGGFENLEINGYQLFIEELTYNAPGNPASGVTLYYSQVYTPQGYLKSSILLYGQIQTLLIGGQEFFLDNIKLPVGGGQLQKFCVDFESLPPGTAFGNPMNSNGDFIFEENFIPVFVRDFYWDAVTTHFGTCQVTNASPDFGTGQVMSINNLNLEFDFGHFGSTNYVKFECADYGGFENFQVNGGPLFIGELGAVSGNPAPGITFYISKISTHFIKSSVMLIGNVNNLLVGGQEFFLDNVCALTQYQVSVDEPAGCMVAPKNFELSQNFPNPFNPETEIRFQVPQSGSIVINIYNILGENICTLVNALYDPGYYSVVWDGKDKFGAAVTSGIYLYKLEAGDFSQTKKMNLLR